MAGQRRRWSDSSALSIRLAFCFRATFAGDWCVGRRVTLLSARPQKKHLHDMKRGADASSGSASSPTAHPDTRRRTRKDDCTFPVGVPGFAFDSDTTCCRLVVAPFRRYCLRNSFNYAFCFVLNSTSTLDVLLPKVFGFSSLCTRLLKSWTESICSL